MRYRLRTLLIVLAVLPALMGAAWAAKPYIWEVLKRFIGCCG